MTKEKYFTFEALLLESGEKLGPVTLAYETYGILNEKKTNAVLVLHALSGDAHAAGIDENRDNLGWWDALIGPGKAFDTNKYFVICSNVLGGCKGSTGPSSINPKTGKPYALDFPLISIGDIVNAQKRLIEHLGIEKLLAVAGGSMGGMQALSWLVKYPKNVRSVIPIATAIRHSPQQIAFNEVGRQAIMADPHWKEGNYYDGPLPVKGLAVARMIGHITYMSEQSMAEKFGRQKKGADKTFKFTADFEVEGYLRYRGDNFVKRFDANSYLYITKAMDNFDASQGKPLQEVLQGIKAKLLVIAFKSDWLYPAYQSKEIVKACKLSGAEATYCEIDSTYGHDAFLLEVEEETHLITHFLKKVFYEYEVTGNYAIYEDIRADHKLILGLVKSGATVLDLGCGTGELLFLLIKEKGCRGQGIEINEQAIYKCVAKGLNVFHGDIDTGLAEYKDKSFDYVVLNQSLQQIRRVDSVLNDSLRVGKKVIVGFPNFAHYRGRLQMFFRGRAPVTGALPYQWYETPNLHFLSISDFLAYCRLKNITVERSEYVSGNRPVRVLPNLFAQVGIFLISK